MKQLDMKGCPCPMPVVHAKKELDKADCPGVVVEVDNFVAVQNLEKLSNSMGAQFQQAQMDDGVYFVTIMKCADCCVLMDFDEPAVPEVPAPIGGATVLIGSNQMGRGSEELGKMLLKGFVFSLTQLPTRPKVVLFLNSGIDLVCEGSNVIDDLQTLLEGGTEVIACGTCLNYYGKTEQLKVGNIGDMFAIANHLAVAHPLISL